MIVKYIGKLYNTKYSVVKNCYKQIIISRSFSKSIALSNANAQENQPSYLHHVGQHPLIYRTVGQACSMAAEEYPNRDCLISHHENQRYTFGEINEKINQLASGFISSGLKKGDRIGIWAPNYSFWYMSIMAAAKAGLISVVINPGYQTSEIEYCINKVEMKAIVTPDTFKTQKYYNMIRELAPELEQAAPGQLKSTRIPSLTTVIIASDNDFAGAYKFNDIFSLATEASNQELANLNTIIQPDDPLNIQFTSGTTGTPKAAVLTHFGFTNNAFICGRRLDLNSQMNQEPICMQLPMFHVFGTLILFVSLLYKIPIVLPEAGFSPEASLQAIEKEKCSTIFGAPTMFVDLVAKQKERNFCLDSLKMAFSGGASCSPHLFKQIKETLKVEKVLQGYGLTETSSVLCAPIGSQAEELTLNTVGHIQDHAEVKVIDKEGNIVPMGTPGEVCIRFYGNMLGYWADPEKTVEVMGPDGWFRTGDKFILQPNGYGSIVGRIKDMILRGGENIYPVEIEDFINTHPDVLEAHVIGVPDERMGEEICAFVRIREGAKFNQEILKSFCKGKIAHIKIPLYVEIIDDFPKTLTGKVQKFKLKKIAEKRLNKKLPK